MALQVHSSDRIEAGEPSQDDVTAMLALFRQQQYAEARLLAEQLLHRFPQHGFTWKALGAIHKKSGDLQAAISALSNATLLLPQDADVHYNLGLALRQAGRIEEANAHFEAATRLSGGR